MAHEAFDLLSMRRGTVTAPAGCGKTHLIAESVARHGNSKKPILILTHTNAGVAALRGRLDRAGIRPTAYRLLTIDGWGMRLVSMFPQRSGHDPSLLDLANPGTDYPNIRLAAARLLKAGHINDVVSASFARLIVDEYQDCSVRQHALVGFASNGLPTSVLGDPLQAIFGFGQDDLAKWDQTVCKHFPLAGELATPWRWINAGTEALGEWLLEVRRKLLCGEPIDLRDAPPELTWIELDGKENRKRQLAAARANAPGGTGSVLIIGDSRSPDSQRQFASETPGAVTVEAVDLKDLVTFARQFNVTAPDALQQLAQFGQTVMTNVGAADLVRRVEALNQNPGQRNRTDLDKAALEFIGAPSYPRAVEILVEIGKQAGVRAHRPAVLRACIKALQMCHGIEGLSFADAAVHIREQNRLIGRPLPKRAVGSTLLLKGLEAEVAVVLDAANLDARNLYVAMTRGSKKLIICSESPVLNVD